jgi:hypothetical protein
MVVLLVTHIMLGKACQEGQVTIPCRTLNKLGPRGPIIPPTPTLTTLAYPCSSPNNGTTHFKIVNSC